MIFRVILRIILLLILLLLLMPEGVSLKYRNGKTKIRLKILGIPFDLDTKKKEKKSSDKEVEKKPEEPKKSLKDKLKSSGITLEILPELLRPVKGLLRFLLQSIIIRNVFLELTVNGSTPEKVGKNTGYIWAAVGNMINLLSGIFTLRVKDIVVVPNFTSSENNTTAEADVLASPLVLLVGTIYFGVRLLVIYLKLKKGKDNKNE